MERAERAHLLDLVELRLGVLRRRVLADAHVAEARAPPLAVRPAGELDPSLSSPHLVLPFAKRCPFQHLVLMRQLAPRALRRISRMQARFGRDQGRCRVTGEICSSAPRGADNLSRSVGERLGYGRSDRTMRLYRSGGGLRSGGLAREAQRDVRFGRCQMEKVVSARTFGPGPGPGFVLGGNSAGDEDPRLGLAGPAACERVRGKAWDAGGTGARCQRGGMSSRDGSIARLEE